MRFSKTIYMVSIITFSVFLLFGGAYDCGMFQRHSPYVHQKISGPVTVSNEWTEVKPEEPLRLTGDYQEIGLYVEKPLTAVFDSSTSGGIRTPDGSLIMPEVEVVDDNNKTFECKFSGAWGSNAIRFRLPDVRPNAEYKVVRIRADRLVQLDGVYWTGVIIKNLP